MRNGKDPDPYLWLTDADRRGPKTNGSGTLLLRILNSSSLDRTYPWLNPLPVHVERARVPEHGQVRIPVRIQKGNDGLASSASSCRKNTLLFYQYSLSVYITFKKRRIFNIWLGWSPDRIPLITRASHLLLSQHNIDQPYCASYISFPPQQRDIIWGNVAWRVMKMWMKHLKGNICTSRATEINYTVPVFNPACSWFYTGDPVVFLQLHVID